MRSTRASNAVLRLKQRSDNAPYSMVSMADGRFYLILTKADAIEKLCVPLEQDSFVSFVNSLGKQTPKKASKLDLAFEAKLQASYISKE